MTDGGCGFEEFGNLCGAELYDVAQDQYGALTRGKLLQGRHHGQPHTVPRRDGVFRRREHVRVGDRLQPLMGAGAAAEIGVRVNRAVTQAGRQHAPGAVLQRTQARRGGDPVQPGSQRRTLLERLIATPATQVGLLDQVFGVVHRAEHAVAVRDQFATKRGRLLDEILLSRHGRSPIWESVPDGPRRYSSTETSGRKIHRSAAMNSVDAPYLNL